MTLANLIETGSGRLAARWEIEGEAIQFCTEPGMEQTIADGRRRLCLTSLKDCGFSIEERTNLPEAKIEGTGSGLLLWETVDEVLADTFFHAPEREYFGEVTLETASTFLTLYSTDGIAEGDVLHIGTEAIYVDAVDHGTRTLTVLRSYWGTVAQKHWAADTPGVPMLVVTDRPLRTRGRRVRLYLYGDGDDLQGDGTLVWRGVVRSEPMMGGSGTNVRLDCGHVAELLKSKVGGDLASPGYARGIYYHSQAALYVEIFEQRDAGTTWAEDRFTGFYESQVEFITALTAWLTTPGASDIADAAGLESTLQAEVTADGRWTVRVTVGATVNFFTLHLWSTCDGETGRRPEDMLYGAPDGGALGYATLSSGEYLYPQWIVGPEGGRTVPRGHHGLADPRFHKPADAATWPLSRIYLSKQVDATWTAATIRWQDGTGGTADTGALPYDIGVTSSAEDYIEATQLTGRAGGGGHVHTSLLRAEIRAQRNIATGHLGDLRDGLVAEGAEYCNLGTAPFLTGADLANWDTVVTREAVFPWQTRRFWTFEGAVDVEELIANECRLLSVYPITDSTGAISLAALDLPSATSTTAFDIDEEISLIDGRAVELSTAQRGNQTVNRVVLHTGYAPGNETWLNTIEVTDQTSYALDHQDRPLEIKPRSWAYPVDLGTLDRLVDPLDVSAAVTPLLALFGYPHDFARVRVTWKAFNVRLGDAVTFSADHLPDYTSGRRPIANVLATVTGRKWKLNEAYGELEILISWLNVAGYAPSAMVDSEVNTAGDTWELTIDTSLYFAAGEDPTTHFAVGDKVRILPIDDESAAASTITGTVTAVTATVITVDFDATWTPGSATWQLSFTTYSNATNPGQTDYAFFAGTDLVLGSGDAPRTLGP